MQRVPDPPNTPKEFGEGRVIERFGLALNGGALIAFALGLVCCALPGLQVIMDLTIPNVVFAPLYLLIGIHVAGIYWLVSLPLALLHRLTGVQDDLSLDNGFTLVVAVCMILWLVLVWAWGCYAVFARKASTWRLNRFRWLTPLLLGLLSVLWISHIPLSLTFAYHKPALEQLANQVMASPSGRQEFAPPRRLGIFDVHMASRKSPTIISIVIDSNWAAQGFVRDLSRKPGGLAANTYSLAPGSNNGDQELFSLGDGWYVFQNLFD